MVLGQQHRSQTLLMLTLLILTLLILTLLYFQSISVQFEVFSYLRRAHNERSLCHPERQRKYSFLYKT